MALDYSSDNITNEKYTPASAPHSAREVYRAIGTVVLDDAVEAADLFGLVVLPANCIPTDIKIISTVLDSVADMVIDVGILNADKDDLVPSSLLIDGSEVCQAGGVADMDDHEGAFVPATWIAEATCPDINVEKIVAVKVMTVAATPAAGTIYAMVDYRSAENGV